MLKITFKETESTIWDIDPNFDNLFSPEWLEDPLVVRMIEDVDKSKVLSPYCIQSPVLGQIAPSKLSGGVKALILMLKVDAEIWATACGDNCAKWILEIAKTRELIGKDLTICLENYMIFDEDVDFFCIDTGRMENYEEYTERIGLDW